jgi:periplasmic divalent cation tolerance protein
MRQPDPAETLVALTTLEDMAQAQELVRRLVDDRLVACGTVLPGATSIYRWEGAVTTASETVVLLKTTRARWAGLVAAVERHHPYSVPELLALPVVAGLADYVAWVAAETGPETVT